MHQKQPEIVLNEFNSRFELYFHSRFHISLVSFLYIGNLLFGSRIKCSKCFSTFRIVPFIINENLNFANTFSIYFIFITLVYFGSSFHTGFGAGTTICRIEVLELWRRRKDAEIERQQYMFFSKLSI
jgi:hypothetical protein